MTAQILVVDDEPDMKALVLQKFRYQIRDGAIRFLFASDGVEALAMLEGNGEIDMVVTDINMPRMDGLALLQKLQETTENLSTIIVSAYGACAFNRSVQHRLQSIGWRLEAQGLSRTLIEPQSNRVQITLRDAREIGSSREVLPQQAVGVLV